MSFAEIEQEVETLTAIQQRKLMARLMALKLRRDKVWKTKITRTLNDKSPGAWVPLEVLERRLEKSK